LPGQYYDGETGLHYNCQRFFDPHIGRYVSIDPIKFRAVDQNLYRYGKNNSINKVDSLGLWGAEIHYGLKRSDGSYSYGTYKWAQDVGMTELMSRQIAFANNDTDANPLGGNGTGFSPKIGDQSRHFNLNPPNEYKDSRDFWAETELKNAIYLFKSGKECEAIRHLGYGLHSLQDKYAHRDWNTGPSGRKIHPPWYDDIYDSRNRQALYDTEQSTKEYLNKFIIGTRNR
jgi:RHS repeat-associated protein